MNVHILPTQNESRLYYNSQERTYQLCEFPKYHTDIKSTHNLSITSDEEGVYDKDYYLYEGSVFQARPRDEGNFKNKIILTTDQDLIKNGVQSIPDEFLEWFIKNPSCEEVEIVEGDIINGEYTFGKYHIRRMYYAEESKEEPKQETLEEFINEELEDVFFTNISKRKEAERLIELGTKWQQEQDKNKYSEEDMIKAVMFGELYQTEGSKSLFERKGTTPSQALVDFIEQFKKK
jgi:hypothetical protein